MHAAAIVMLSLAFQAAPAKEAEPALKPLCEVAKRLDDGIKAFMAGKDMKESFKEWDKGETREDVVAKFREDLAKNHVTAARMFALEIRLVFYSEGKLVYDVSALMHATPTEAGLLAMHGRKSTGTGKVGLLLDKCEKDAKPFATAGQALLKMVKTEKGADLPWVDPKKITGLVPPAFEVNLKAAMEKAKEDLAAVRKDLVELKHDEVKIQLDEQFFTPFGVEGLNKDAFIRGKLRFTPEGEVTFRLSRYETK